MRKLAASLLFTAISLTVAGANAAPIQPPPKVTAEMIEVRGLCGVGRHRGPWGGCLPNGVGYYGYAPYYAYAAPYYRCWWRSGPRGPVRVCAW